MNNFKDFKFFGFFLLFLGIAAFFFGLVLPYSRLIGKKTLDFPTDPEVSSRTASPGPVLPIFDKLREKGSATKLKFYLSINKLGIKRAPITMNVVVNNLKPDYLNALETSLAHLSGTALPGQRGNSLIFGHSALPYLYNSQNFQTIFTRLDELEFGDLIEVEGGGQILKYKVERGGLVPSKSLVSDFTSGKSRLTLLSCYPPGFKSEKYAVRAVLVN